MPTVKEPWKASDKGMVVLEFLRTQESPLTGLEIAEATGFNQLGIHGILKPLVNEGLVSKSDKIRMTRTNKAGLSVEKDYVGYAITEAGMNYSRE